MRQGLFYIYSTADMHYHNVLILILNFILFFLSLEKFLRHFSSPFGAMGNSSSAAVAAAHCPAPFALPFTPFGLSLFDIDPSRILGMLQHQTWLAEEALK